MDQLLATLQSYGDFKTFTSNTSHDWIDTNEQIFKQIAETPPEKQGVLNFLAYIDIQLAKKDFPPRNSDGRWHMTKILRHVMDEVRRHNVYEKAFNGELFDLMITCVKAGPGSGHLEVLSHLPIDKYFYENVETERVSKLLAAYAGNILADPPPDDELDGGYSSNLVFPFRHIGHELFRPHLQQFRDMWIVLLFRITECSEKVGYALNSLSDRLEIIMRNHLKVPRYLYPDKTIVIGHMDQFKGVMVKEKYPVTKYARRNMDQLIRCMTKSLAEDTSIRKEVINHLNVVMLAIVQGGNKNAMNDVMEWTRHFLRDHGKEIKHSPEQNGQIMPNIINIIKDITTSKDADKFWDEYGPFIRDNFIKSAKPENWENTLEFVMVCLDCGHAGVMKLASTVMDKRKTFDWKKTPKAATNIFDKLDSLGDDPGRMTRNYGTFSDKFLSHLKSQKVIADYQHRLMEINRKAFTSNESLLKYVARHTLEETNWVKYKDHIHEVLALVLTAIEENVEKERNYGVGDSVYFALIFIMRSLTHGQDATFIAEDLAKIFHICKDREWKTDGNKETVEYYALKTIMGDYMYRHVKQSGCLEPMIDDVKELWECGDKELEQYANNIMKGASNSASLLGEDTVAGIIQSYIDGEEPQAITEFPKYYEQVPHLILNRLAEIVGKLEEGGDDWMAITTMSLVYTIARDNPKVIDKKMVDLVANNMDGNGVYTGLQVLQMVANDRPEDVIQHEPKILDIFESNKMAATMVPNILNALATNEKLATKYMDILAKEAQKFESMQKITFYYSMRTLGIKYREVLAKHKPLFLKEKEDNALAETAQAVIDVIEGRSLAGLSEDVAEQGEQLNELEDRVDATEENVENLSREVETTQTDVFHLKEESVQAEERLNTLEDVVEETVERVDDLDLKTLSHAPAWSPEVSKLLNPEAEHDWRLLASRLGYSAEDIKNWATQPDPCLSLLDEWFATHKTREATYAVLKCMEDMNREDAAVIVHDALAAVENIVGEEPPDLTEPPPVFISYQWGIQSECKMLKKHLEMAGFKSWMDIGQMGGGDKLYAKIDEGIRAAKVVICCVSEKYAQSPNCNREVNLSVTLGKPIIPLLMEKMAWPPPGSMGPIFGEYLFIRFFQRTAEATDDGLYWPIAKFQELLMQLRYQIIPDETLINEEYKGWWAPVDEDIIIKPKDEKSKGKSQLTERAPDSHTKSVISASPEIFISYQWGKQPQIKALFKRLSKLGFTCWLDIMQMGGGDSLYDKIDRGVRGCKVVVSCVTTKYSLSANCRREVSLADALKKPIIPLLLEDMTWPPEGPMSMSFTQLLYINFYKPDDSIQSHWECPQFEELLQKIIGNVKPMQAEETPLDNTPVAQEEKSPVKPPTPAPREKTLSRPPSAKSKPRSRPPSAKSKVPSRPASAQSTPRVKSPTPSEKTATSQACQIL